MLPVVLEGSPGCFTRLVLIASQSIILEAQLMALMGRVQDGMIVFDQPLQVPDGTVARVDLLSSGQTAAKPPQPRQGGQWKGQVAMAPDFDVLPDDIQEAFGMKDS